MIKYLLLFFLTLFQDNYVRIGTAFGLMFGLWGPDFFRGENNTNIFIFGFIGWGLGVFIANYFEGKGQLYIIWSCCTLELRWLLRLH